MFNKLKAGFLRWQARRINQAIKDDRAVIAQGEKIIAERYEALEQIRRELLALGSMA